MIKLFIKMMMFVTVANWLYAEAALIAPGSVPYLDEALKRLQIPTHDKWDLKKLERFALDLESKVTKEGGGVEKIVQRLRTRERGEGSMLPDGALLLPISLAEARGSLPAAPLELQRF